jgi:hypothetical protein
VLGLARIALILWEVHDVRKSEQEHVKRNVSSLIRESLISSAVIVIILLAVFGVGTMAGLLYHSHESSEPPSSEAAKPTSTQAAVVPSKAEQYSIVQQLAEEYAATHQGIKDPSHEQEQHWIDQELRRRNYGFTLLAINDNYIPSKKRAPGSKPVGVPTEAKPSAARKESKPEGATAEKQAQASPTTAPCTPQPGGVSMNNVTSDNTNIGIRIVGPTGDCLNGVINRNTGVGIEHIPALPPTPSPSDKAPNQ